MEYILILVAQLHILGVNTILPSSLTHNRPNQCTPRQTFWITTYQIYKGFCRHNVHFHALSHLICYHNNLVLTQYAITTLTHATAVRTHHHLCYIIYAWFTHTTVCCQTRHTNTTINPTYRWVTPFQNPFLVSHRFAIHPVHTVAMILSLGGLPPLP